MNGFPPPIPLLARTGNLPSHMPWVLRRFYTDDGRLILREERVKHHEYFQAHRCNGRLTLRLVPLDDEVHPPYPHGFADEGDDNENEFEYCQEEEEEVKNELENCRIEQEDETNELENCCSENCQSEEEKENKDEADQGKDTQVNDNEKVDECCDGGVDYFHSSNGIIAKEVLYEDQRVPSLETGNSGIGGNLSAFKCLNIYNSVRPGSNRILGVPVPAMRPVHG
ncbi:hypothetical protein P3X46_021740 [Hevea brasiliensis]|uniref:FAF domain-containing protein n=1 Tax=Hevea brasiliensis TaxID=3981 RepID=A0ABQ9LKC4_HEVBR|nr:uncharacterized protein LOC110645831 [Hevea brasiliensis]KAJ9167061.1 hypothetical protein P3X46_021740 [Hevea brasiliensis]